jgi:hypothetical protein
LLLDAWNFSSAMSDDPVIKVSDLGKRYQLGLRPAVTCPSTAGLVHHDLLAEKITACVGA